MDAVQRHLITVLMFPWLGYGHISPYLQLAKKLTKRNFYIYFCSTPVNLDAIKAKLGGNYSLPIQLVQLHLPSSPELPPHCHTTNGLPPHLMPTLRTAFDMAGPDFYGILRTLNPDLLIYDFIPQWAAEAASSLNIPAVQFLSTSAMMQSLVLCWAGKRGIGFPFEEACLSGYEISMYNRLLDSSVEGIRDQDRDIQSSERSCKFILIRTFREIEGKYLDYLSDLSKKKIVPVGPLLPDPDEESDEAVDVVEWLNKKDEASAVFVSFGSEYFAPEEELKEIAYGLELSEVNFIWVVRFPTGEKTKLEEALPEGFLQRVGGRGLVVEGWAPQRKILGHSSTGGFVSHCGWSSVMEAMEFGVPIIAMPMHLDQPANAKVVEAVGVGREVKRDEKGKLGREEIAKVIKWVMDEKNDQENHVRRKAGEMMEMLKKKGDEEIDVVVKELLQLCHG